MRRNHHVRSFVRFQRKYHFSQKLIVFLGGVMFFLGCYLLSIYTDFPDPNATKIEGNLEPAFDSVLELRDAVLSCAISLMVLPFFGIAGVALRIKRIISVYFCQSICVVLVTLTCAIYCTVYLVEASDSCTSVGNCYECSDSEQPVKCRVLAQFAMKECFFYRRMYSYVCTDALGHARKATIWLYIVMVLCITNSVVANISLNNPLAFLDIYGSSSSQLQEDENEFNDANIVASTTTKQISTDSSNSITSPTGATTTTTTTTTTQPTSSPHVVKKKRSKRKKKRPTDDNDLSDESNDEDDSRKVVDAVPQIFIAKKQ